MQGEEKPDQPSGKKEGWLAFIDVYGFKHFVLSHRLDFVAGVMEDIHQWSAQHLPEQLDVFLFSDCLCIFSEVSPKATYFEGLNVLDSALMHLQQFACSKQIVFRGSVEFGSIFIGNKICIGKPLIEAYAMEQQLDIPIVCLPLKVLKRIHDPDFSDETKFWRPREIPIKGGGFLSAVPLLPRPVDLLRNHVRQMVEISAQDGPPLVAASWKRLLEFLSETSRMEATDVHSS